jgi:hypothetical protein
MAPGAPLEAEVEHVPLDEKRDGMSTHRPELMGRKSRRDCFQLLKHLASHLRSP